MAGEMDQAKGRLKKAVGELTGNQRMKTEGAIDKASGKAKSGINKVKKTLQGK